MVDQVLELVMIQRANFADATQLEYCRRGYGEHVIPADAIELVGDIPTGFIAVYREEQIVGRAVLGFEADPTFLVHSAGGSEAPWIYAVFVEPEWRGHGVGLALIEKCLEYLVQNGYQYVCLDSNTAGSWYVEKFGFTMSHSGEYEGETFDIYYRQLSGAVVPA
ncbi:MULTISPECIES: GNAT family N-acetyltransferase [Herbaspirillum]|uniref:GNAT family N-acetyltransferase n=2 Tax=Herbaspirillum huttiense TaxID=863372 RepID=A0AAJ2HCF1_9BURK|nr:MULTISPECIES: GNAT family N-acetyltransferase [Herbaspirillum]MDR9836968.1 GNAT family N-acetyltransferase [Herbaspirillum huttiense]